MQNNYLESRETGQPELVTVGSGSNERHSDQFREMKDQEIT